MVTSLVAPTSLDQVCTSDDQHIGSAIKGGRGNSGRCHIRDGDGITGQVSVAGAGGIPACRCRQIEGRWVSTRSGTIVIQDAIDVEFIRRIEDNSK